MLKTLEFRAGSLLELTLAEISFPVGRVHFLEMYPLSFAEYLWAIGNEKAADVVLGEPAQTPEPIHAMVLEDLKRYCFVGGMPEAMATYAESLSMQDAFEVHSELCETFREDSSKYARRSDPDCLAATLSGGGQERRAASEVLSPRRRPRQHHRKEGVRSPPQGALAANSDGFLGYLLEAPLPVEPEPAKRRLDRLARGCSQFHSGWRVLQSFVDEPDHFIR